MEVEQYKATERGSRSRGRGRQPRLSLGPPALSWASRMGCLSHTELEEWSEKYSLPDRELRACESAVHDCYKPHPLLGLSRLKNSGQNRGDPIGNWDKLNHDVSISATKYSLSLSRWVRCQTAQTYSKTIGSSEKTKQFVSLLEFLDLMYSSEGLGESYSAEMAAFFDPSDISAGDTVSGVTGRGAVTEQVRERRRRLPSDSSEDCDFREEVKKEKQEPLPTETEPGSPVDIVCLPDSPQLNSDLLPSNNERVFPVASQHIIPQAPSCESLDWLDAIEPTQVSTPLTSSHRPHPLPNEDFKFALPRTPPSSRSGKPLFVTPLTTVSLPDQSEEGRQQLVTDHQSSIDSVDLFNDISSTALFEEFSDWNTSQPHQTEIETERGEVVNTSQPHKTETEREEMVAAEHFDCDHNITSVPESEGKEDEREESEIVSVVASSVLGTSEASDESLIGGCGQRRQNIARPDFLSTQAPPTFLSPLATTTSVSSDDEDFIEPLARRLKRKKREQRDGWLRKRESSVTRGDSKRACLELNELIDREAELSGHEKEEVEEEDCEDGYDMEDSFINDNSVLTQVQKH